VNPKAVLLATDASSRKANNFEHNAWISGYFGSEDESSPYVPGTTEHRLTTFEPSWFAAFSTVLGHEPSAFVPTPSAPWLDKGTLLADVPTDRNGCARRPPADLGPYER